MATGSFADYLAGLDEADVIAILRARPDVRVEPVPRGFGQLAQRLGGADSLSAALLATNRDALVVGQAIAALGVGATRTAAAGLLGASERMVDDAVAGLCRRGMAWADGEELRLPERLADHWSGEIGGGKPALTLARAARVEDLKVTAGALGIDVNGLRKPELVERIGAALGEARVTAGRVARLPRALRERLDLERRGAGSYYAIYDPSPVQRSRLIGTGLVLAINGRLELPREVTVALWLAEQEVALTGRPDLAPATAEPTTLVAAAQAAVGEFLRAMTSLLDEARTTPIAALKKGGVGSRERSRLAARLSVPGELVPLCLDLAYAAGLLGPATVGYVPTSTYDDWRAGEPARQWAELATAWFALDHAPTSRGIEGEKELPPPLPLLSGAGAMRRALLRAARGGGSVRAAGEHVDWFCPLHGYEDPQRGDKVAAAVREGELLGVVAADALTNCGEQLLAASDADSADPVDDLRGRVAALLPDAPGRVIVQSDLTAVVTGRPSPAAARLLRAAATSEARGSAGVWRFTPASVRGALDAGWVAGELLTQLAAVSEAPLPQPLTYLVNDVARRHGHVRVRGMRCCVVADEATTKEMLHTRSLAVLHLARVAPTVLSSPLEPDKVLDRLRAAGLSPVAEDSQGMVIVEGRPEHQAPAAPRTAASRGPASRGATSGEARTGRGRITAADLAGRLASDPGGDTIDDPEVSGTREQLAALNPALDDAELILLSTALAHADDVLITYRDKNGTYTVREIQPRQLYGRWLDSWCHLRNGQRDFAVANIEAVAPAR